MAASDVGLAWYTDQNRADIALDPVSGDLIAGPDLATAAIISLFSDRRAETSDQLVPGEDDPRGWYGDTFLQSLTPGDRLGSRLWLLRRVKSNDRLPLVAKQYIQQALQWMLDDGLVSTIQVTTFFLKPFDQTQLGAIVVFTRLGQAPAKLTFNWAWQQLGIALERTPTLAS
jgi:phage gp46-like protein